MKKFLTKKAVWITCVALSAVLLIAYIVMLARPVAYGFTYSYKSKENDVYKINVKNDSYATVTVHETASEYNGETDSKYVVDMWIYRDGDKVITLGTKEIKSGETNGKVSTKEEIAEANESSMTKEEYETKVNALKELKKNNKASYDNKMKYAMEVNAFQIKIQGLGENGEVAVSAGTIVFAVLAGVVELVLLAGDVLAIVYLVKDKKTK